MKRFRVVYTAIFGDYDTLKPIKFSSQCDFVCFSDRDWNVAGWKIIRRQIKDLTPSLMNRKIKILAHKYLPDYEESLYVDGNIIINHAPDELMNRYAKAGIDIATPRHPYRNCVFEEGATLLRSKRLSLNEKFKLAKQLQRYRDFGFPSGYGLTENNLIYRKHNNASVIALSNLWWAELRSSCPRDQISLPFAIWRSGVTVEHFLEGPRFSSKFFDYGLHANDVSRNPLLNWARLTRFRSGQSRVKSIFGALINATDRIRRNLIKANPFGGRNDSRS